MSKLNSDRRSCVIFVAFCVAAAAMPETVGAADGANEPEAGFTSLFNGRNLDGWVGDVEGYAVRDGAIVCLQAKGGNLFAAKEYANFILRFEVKIPPGGNNGIAIRSPQEKGNVAYSGTEIQVLDDPHPMYANIKPYQHHGSVYGVVAATPGALKPAGEWNTQQIAVEGRRVKVTLNGRTIVDADLDEATRNGTLDEKPHPGLSRTSGYLGFLGHGSPVEFRNVRIKELPAGR